MKHVRFTPDEVLKITELLRDVREILIGLPPQYMHRGEHVVFQIHAIDDTHSRLIDKLADVLRGPDDGEIEGGNSVGNAALRGGKVP